MRVYMCVHMGDAHQCMCMQRRRTSSILFPRSPRSPLRRGLPRKLALGWWPVSTRDCVSTFHPTPTGVTGSRGWYQFLMWVLQILIQVLVLAPKALLPVEPSSSLSWCPFLWALVISGVHVKGTHSPACVGAAHCPVGMLDSDNCMAAGCGITSQPEAILK